MVTTAFEVFSLLKELKEVYDLLNTISDIVIDKTARIVQIVEENAAEKEFLAARQALEDAKRSNNPARELESAITLLRTALNKTSDLEKSYQISMTITLCYRMLGEAELARSYGNKAIEYVDQYIENYIVTIGCSAAASELTREAFGDYLPLPVRAVASGVAVNKDLQLKAFFRAFWHSFDIDLPLRASFFEEDFLSPDTRKAKETARKAHDAVSLYVNTLLS